MAGEKSPSTLEARIEAVTDSSIDTDLEALKSEINCLGAEKLVSLQAIIEAKNTLSIETKKKLNSLLKECAPDKARESKAPFEQVFDGTRSEMFSFEGVRLMQDAIDASFDQKTYGKLQPKQQGNIRLAMTDRLLKDPEIQKLFDMKIGVVDILGNLAKNGPKDPKAASEAKESPSVTASVSQAASIETTIKDRLAIATKPLADLLLTNNNPAVLLSNPKAISQYNGGEISPDIKEMSDPDLKEYIKALKGNISAIDAKVFPMEAIKEKGMEFLASAPGFLVDFFKWLLSFGFIAKLLGYSGTKEEKESQFEDERRQRRSLGLLREFGKVASVDGKARDGENSGKIKMLEGQDLSKLNRKRLKDFFVFTKEEDIDMDAHFWMGVFNEGKIMAKGKEGKEDMTYELKSSIKPEDLEKNFEGLYSKLNGLHSYIDEKKKKEYAAAQANISVPTSGETDAGGTSLGEISKLNTLQFLTAAQRSKILMGQVEWQDMAFMERISPIKWQPLLKEVEVLNQICKNNPLFVKQIRKESKKTVLNLEDVWAHKDKAISILAVAPLVQPKPKAAQASEPAKTSELPKDEITLLKEAFQKAQDIPFQFGEGKWVKFEGNRLMIGERQFALRLNDGGGISPEVSGIRLIGWEVRLGYLLIRSAMVERSEIIKGIPALLEMKNGTDKEIPGKAWRLIVTRVV